MKLLIGIGGAVLVLVGIIVAFERLGSAPVPVLQPVGEAEITDAFTDEHGASFRWQGGAINTRTLRLPPGRRTIETLYLGPNTETVIELRAPASAPELGVTLTSPAGQPVALTATTALDETSGETIRLYSLPPHRESGGWQLSIENNDQTATTSVDVATPGATPPLNVITDTAPINNAGSEVALTLTVEETSSDGLVVQTVSGVSVVAVVTAPDGTVTTIVLVEDPEHPGTYTGEYPAATQTGTYEVEYIITGTNNAGQPFTQITTDQFVVAGSGGAATTTNSVWNKKYDINRGDQINIINY